MVILVTGGTKGIGRGIAERFAEPGATLFLNYAHDDEAARSTAHHLESRGAVVHLVKQDVGTAEGATRAIEVVAGATTRLDQVVHCAVVPTSRPAMDITPAEFERCVGVNGAALLYLVQAARPLLARGSSVVLLSSRGSKVAIPSYVGVGAAKALAEALVRYLAVELAPDGVRVNTVSPGPLLTDAFRAAVPDAEARFAAAASANPSGRNLVFGDVADTIHFLASEGAAMITGQELVVDGGLYSRA